MALKFHVFSFVVAKVWEFAVGAVILLLGFAQSFLGCETTNIIWWKGLKLELTSSSNRFQIQSSYLKLFFCNLLACVNKAMPRLHSTDQQGWDRSTTAVKTTRKYLTNHIKLSSSGLSHLSTQCRTLRQCSGDKLCSWSLSMAIWTDNAQASERVWNDKVCCRREFKLASIDSHFPDATLVWRVHRSIKLHAKLVQTAENCDLEDARNLSIKTSNTWSNFFTSCFDSISLMTSVSIRLFPCTGLLILLSSYCTPLWCAWVSVCVFVWRPTRIKRKTIY